MIATVTLNPSLDEWMELPALQLGCLNRATGFVFDEHSARALLETVKRAIAAFRDHALWTSLVQTGMRQDFSWARSARDYVRVYERAMAKVAQRAASHGMPHPVQRLPYRRSVPARLQ